MINKKTLTKIRESKKCKTLLALALDKSVATINRYLDTNDVMLTTAVALQTIGKELNLTNEQMLTKTLETA